MTPRMLRIHQLLEFGSQDIHLVVVQEANALQIAVLAEEFDLLVAEPIVLEVFSVSDVSEQGAHWTMVFR